MRQQSVILAGVAATALLVAAVLPDTSPVAARAAAQQAPLPSASTPSPQVTPAVARPAPGTTPASPSTASAAAVMSRYCVTCHNARLKSGGLELDVSQLANLGANAETLEKVVNKLRTKTMPPAGAPRPDAATYVTATRELETALDREAERHPNLGTLPLAHRLARPGDGLALHPRTRPHRQSDRVRGRAGDHRRDKALSPSGERVGRGGVARRVRRPPPPDPLP